jgi:hypothetical protein
MKIEVKENRAEILEEMISKELAGQMISLFYF